MSTRPLKRGADGRRMKNQVSPTHLSSEKVVPRQPLNRRAHLSDTMNHDSHSQLSFSQSQPLFDSGMSSGRVGGLWSQSSNSQSNSQPTNNRLSRGTLLAHNAGSRSRPPSDSGRTNASQSRMTMKDFFSVKKSRPLDLVDRNSLEDGTAEIAKKCVSQVQEATDIWRSILEEHSQTQKELLSTQTNSVFEELSNHCRIVAAEVKLREDVTDELSELKSELKAKEKDLVDLKQQLEASLDQETRRREDISLEQLNTHSALASQLTSTIDQSKQHTVELKEAAATMDTFVQSLSQSVSDLVTCIGRFQPLISDLSSSVSLLHNPPVKTKSHGTTPVSGCQISPKYKSSLSTSSSSASDASNLNADVNYTWPNQQSTRTSIASHVSSSNMVESKTVKSMNRKQSRALEEIFPLPEKFGDTQKVQAEIKNQPTRHVTNTYKGTRAARMLPSGSSSMLAASGKSRSNCDIFDITICSGNTSSDSEQEYHTASQAVRTRNPLQFKTIPRPGASKRAPPHAIVSSLKTVSASDMRKSTTAPSPPRKRLCKTTVTSMPSTQVQQQTTAKQTTCGIEKTVSGSQQDSMYDWTPDPAADLFDSLFKGKATQHTERRISMVRLHYV